MLGIRVGVVADAANAQEITGWNEMERAELRATTAARKTFLEFAFGRVNTDGLRQQFKLSGEPIFNQFCRFVGYRGIGLEVR